MQKVPVLDTSKQTLAPTDSIRARRLLKQNKAAVFKKFPFTIILKREVENPSLPDLTLKIDPGSKTSGVALVNQATGDIVFAAEISHRGQAIKARLESRKALRRGRRNRKTRYRKPRFLNRTRVEGWLPPSLSSRISNVTTWANRLARVFPISGVAMELVKFDLQKMQNPEISGIEYQQGEAQGYEVREYLLEKFNRTCAYCKKKNLALQIEHINARSRGGSNRVSNLTLACQSCNQKKGRMSAAEFGFPEVEKQAKKPLRDAAAVNASRLALLGALKYFGFTVETGSGGLTKFNRTKRNLPKTHWLDAACVGLSTPDRLIVSGVKPLLIKAMGYGSRQMCRTDKFGFPKAYRTRNKTFKGFKTGDIVRSNKPNQVQVGRVTIRQRNSFILSGSDINIKYLTQIQRRDGYGYSQGVAC